MWRRGLSQVNSALGPTGEGEMGEKGQTAPGEMGTPFLALILPFWDQPTISFVFEFIVRF